MSLPHRRKRAPVALGLVALGVATFFVGTYYKERASEDHSSWMDDAEAITSMG